MCAAGARAVGQGAPQRPEVEVRVEQALDRSAPLSARVAAYQLLLGLKAEERDRGLLQVLSRGDEEFAAMAASQLISYRSANIVELTIRQFPKWSESAAAMVLQAVKEQEDPKLLEIPRTFLNAQLNRYPKGWPEGTRANAIFIAALTLNRKGTSGDKDIVRKLILQNGNLRESWLILLDSNQADEEEIAMAKSVYSNAKVPAITRVLAAVVAAKRDNVAAEFAVSEISGFITRYQDQDVGVLMQRATSSETGRNEYLAFQNQLLIVCVLQYFDTERAERLTLGAAGSKNLLIRDAAGLAAAVRWPLQLLRAGQGAFSDDEYVKVLAFTSIKHPQMLQEIMQREFDKKAFNQALRRLHEHGATSVFPIGTVLFD
jgi:hypothetical protein